MLASALLVPDSIWHMSSAAASTDSGEVSPYVGTALLGLVFTSFGALAYSGVWRSWARRRTHTLYKVFPLGIGWSGVGLLVTGLGIFIPGEAADIVVLPALIFAFLAMIGTVWLPRPFLPRWYKIEKGVLPPSGEKRVVTPIAADGRPLSRDPLDEDLRGDVGGRFSVASRLSGQVGGAVQPRLSKSASVPGPSADEPNAPRPPESDSIPSPMRDAE